MMYVDQFEVFRCTNRSIMAAQRSQTSRFSVGFSGGNSEQTVKQPKEVFSRKHRAWLLVQNSKTLKTNPLTCNRELLTPHGKKATSLERFNR